MRQALLQLQRRLWRIYLNLKPCSINNRYSIAQLLHVHVIAFAAGSACKFNFALSERR